MNTIELFQPDKFDASIQIPGDWNELDREELLCITENLLMPYAQPEYFNSVIFHFLINHRAKLQGIELPNDFTLSLNLEDVSINQGLALEWIHKENSLTEQLIDDIYVDNPTLRCLYGPLGSFNDLTCGEFEDCEVFSHLYNIEKKSDYLVMMAAILYRPQFVGRRLQYVTTSWDRCPSPKSFRQLYKEEDDMIVYNAEKVKPVLTGLPTNIIFAIYLWYVGCRSQLTNIFPHVFGGSGNGTPDLAAFTKCIHAGAGPKNGTRDKIRRSLLKAFLMDIEQEAIYAEELDKKTKK